MRVAYVFIEHDYKYDSKNEEVDVDKVVREWRERSVQEYPHPRCWPNWKISEEGEAEKMDENRVVEEEGDKEDYEEEYEEEYEEPSRRSRRRRWLLRRFG